MIFCQDGLNILKLLNQPSSFDSSVLNDIEQQPVNTTLADPPTMMELGNAIEHLSSGKAPGPDGLPPEVFIYGEDTLKCKLLQIFRCIWEGEGVPQVFKDANIVHLYKRKGDRTVCDNHRGISLLCIAGKLLARIIMLRLSLHAYTIGLIPESQCGFRAGRSTTYMIFAIKQLQEKCIEQYKDLYLVFIDLTKAFDTVDRQELWLVLERIGCPSKFVNIIRSFHEGMFARVLDAGVFSDAFQVSSGTKQGCVLAPLLFSIYFSAMLKVAFFDCDEGVDICFRTDRNVFDLRKLQAKTKSSLTQLREFLFADDCSLASYQTNCICM